MPTPSDIAILPRRPRRAGLVRLLALAGILALAAGCSTSPSPSAAPTSPTPGTTAPATAPATASAEGPSQTPGPTPGLSPSSAPYTPARIKLSIAGGAPTFTNPALDLGISEVPGSTKLTTMRFSLSGEDLTGWLPYASTASVTLPATAAFGPQTIKVEAADLDGHSVSASATASYVSAKRSSMTLASRYDIAASLNYGTATIKATEAITISNTSGGLISSLNLSVMPKAFGEFKLSSVTVDGVKAKTSWSNNSNLIVELGRNVRSDEVVMVKLAFGDTAKADISTSLAARLSKVNGIMQVSQWFPVLSDGHGQRYPGDSQFTATAQYRLELTLSAGLTLAAPGTVTKVSADVYTVELAPARDLAFAVSPGFKRLAKSVDGVSVGVYYLPGTAGQTALDSAVASLHAFNAAFGPYPYDTYVLAQATRPGAGNEYPGIVFVGSANLGNSTVVRHETSHQWFYGLLGNDQLRDPWIDEGFAEWVGDHLTGHAYCSTKPVSSSVSDFPNIAADQTSGQCGSYDQTIYFKASTMIAGVRSRMGDDAFFTSIQDLINAHRFGIVNTGIVAENWLAHAKAGDRTSLETYLRKFIDW